MQNWLLFKVRPSSQTVVKQHLPVNLSLSYIRGEPIVNTLCPNHNVMITS